MLFLLFLCMFCFVSFCFAFCCLVLLSMVCLLLRICLTFASFPHNSTIVEQRKALESRVDCKRAQGASSSYNDTKLNWFNIMFMCYCYSFVSIFLFFHVHVCITSCLYVCRWISFFFSLSLFLSFHQCIDISLFAMYC